MLPRIHIFIGIIFLTILYFLFPQITLFNLLIFFASSIFIDGDHYLYYILREKNLSVVKCFQWYKRNVKRTFSLPMNERKKIYSGFYLFHGIEWIIILFVLGFYVNSLFLFVCMGFLLHFLIDTPSELYFKGTIDKSSLIYNLYRFRKLKYIL